MKRVANRASIPLAAALIGAAVLLAGCATAPAPVAPTAAKPVPSAQASEEHQSAPLPDDAAISWTDEAWGLFRTEVPKMVQKIAKKEMEKQARLAGKSVIDVSFYKEQKEKRGM